MYKQLIKVAALGLATVAVLPITGNAQTQTWSKAVVTARGGLNLRDKSCNRLRTFRFNTPLTKFDNDTKNCTINGASVKMVRVSVLNNEGYMAESFLGMGMSTGIGGEASSTTGMLMQNPNFDSTKPSTVITRSGLWLRDFSNPQKLAVKVPFGTTLQSFNSCYKSDGVGTPGQVNVRGTTWQLDYVCYNGQPMATAESLIRNI